MIFHNKKRIANPLPGQSKLEKNSDGCYLLTFNKPKWVMSETVSLEQVTAVAKHLKSSVKSSCQIDSFFDFVEVIRLGRVDECTFNIFRRYFSDHRWNLTSLDATGTLEKSHAACQKFWLLIKEKHKDFFEYMHLIKYMREKISGKLEGKFPVSLEEKSLLEFMLDCKVKNWSMEMLCKREVPVSIAFPVQTGGVSDAGVGLRLPSPFGIDYDVDWLESTGIQHPQVQNQVMTGMVSSAWNIGSSEVEPPGVYNSEQTVAVASAYAHSSAASDDLVWPISPETQEPQVQNQAMAGAVSSGWNMGSSVMQQAEGGNPGGVVSASQRSPYDTQVSISDKIDTLKTHIIAGKNFVDTKSALRLLFKTIQEIGVDLSSFNINLIDTNKRNSSQDLINTFHRCSNHKYMTEAVNNVLVFNGFFTLLTEFLNYSILYPEYQTFLNQLNFELKLPASSAPSQDH